jgi:methylase of polypeptide subunit release factors
VEELPRELRVSPGVFWEPLDTISLRRLIQDGAARGKRVLEIGTGSGVLALCCLRHGATSVVATDINPAALEDALANARRLKLASRLEVRAVARGSKDAFAVIAPGESFDLIVSNPPWEPGTPANVAEYALFDQDFHLMDSLLRGLRQHLTPRGVALLAYGNVPVIRELLAKASSMDLRASLLDERPLDSLPDAFLPGMLIAIGPVLPE